jgi:hypothetical protein
MRFIVGTGRCGSTLLSRMLRCNPQVLEISEFYSGLDWNRRFAQEPMSGDEFVGLLSAPHPFITMAMERGYRPVEVSYPFERAGARYGPRQALPWILAATLPPMVDDPDAFFDDVSGWVRSMPPRSPAVQALALFETLAKRLGRSVWVERSAAAITWMGDLARVFPDARFLHLHRSGEEAALSMREHPVFRLAVMLTYQVPLGERAGMDDLGRLGNNHDHVATLLATRAAPRHFGAFWTAQVLAGFRALREIDRSQYHEVTFEALRTRPEETLAEIVTFLDLPDPHGRWRRDAADLVVDADPPRLPMLSAEEQADLVAACDAGNRLLGRK